MRSFVPHTRAIHARDSLFKRRERKKKKKILLRYNKAKPSLFFNLLQLSSADDHRRDH